MLEPLEMADLYTYSPGQIVLYGTVACGDCRRARQVLKDNNIHYLDIDIDQDNTAAEFVIKHNRGFRSAPTIIFPDGSTLTEPDRATLTEKIQTYKTTA